MADMPTNPDSIPRWVSEVYEAEAAADLLRRADAQLRDLEFVHHDVEPLLAVLATGAERLLKMTYGFVREDEHGAWPAQSEMGTKGWGHRIADLDVECRGLIRRRAHLSTASGDVEKLLTDVDSDELIGRLLTILQRYATNGRFYNLDHLAENQQREEPPRTLWKDLEEAVLRRNPELLTGLAGDPGQYRWARQQMNEQLRVSMDGWRTLYASAWRQAVCGQKAQPYGHLFLPD